MTSAPGKRRGFARLWPYIVRHRRRAALGLLLVPIFTAIQLWIPKVWGNSMRALEALDAAIVARGGQRRARPYVASQLRRLRPR